MRTSHVFFAMPCTMSRKLGPRKLASREPDSSKSRRSGGRAALALGWIATAYALAGCGTEAPGRPNLVLISVDRLAADRMACFGGPSDAGGSICALGERGTLFAWTVSPGWREAPAAASVLTGLTPDVHGVGRDGQSFLADALPSIAEDLSHAGYRTAAFVTRPSVNRSRRLDQGFDHYDDHLAYPSQKDAASKIDLSSAIQAWIDASSSPWFVWIHADRDAGLRELDRLVSRLAGVLDRGPTGPGIVFVGLRGEAAGSAPSDVDEDTDGSKSIGWRTHRVPLIWRPPIDEGDAPPRASFRLTSLIDILPTLRAAAGIRQTEERVGGGRDLDQLSRGTLDETDDGDRFLLVAADHPGGEVGLAAERHLYSRRASPSDGLGRPVLTTSLASLGARFMTLPRALPGQNLMASSVRLDPGPWRSDVLDTDSPVPRLEVHLARQLGEREAARRQRGHQ
jgi:hypothetical protein